MKMTSVWEGNDNEFLRTAIPFYLREPALGIRVLDATHGMGVFWKLGIPDGWQLTAIDIDPGKGVTVMDNRHMEFSKEEFHVIVYDPPHVTHGWSEWDSSGRYGSANEGYGSISYLFPGFLDEAERVLVPGGIVIAKLADQVHSGRFWPQTAEFITMASQQFAVCNIIIKVRESARPQPSGRRQLHAEQRHSYYIILRKGGC